MADLPLPWPEPCEQGHAVARGVVVALDGGAQLEAEAGLDELVALATAGDLAARRAGSKYKASSWELVAHARSCKRMKAITQAMAKAKAQAASSVALLGMVQAEFPSVAHALGFKSQVGVMDEQRVVVVLRLASSAPARGEGPIRLMQARAVSLVARAAIEMQNGS